ncbi:hypothetical protein ACFSFY_00540 [Sporosarcina siberiensis]|uniref:Resolvase HTH domain-containing protein n=1 Tax=Sporosarcina siberiensis TaxID=1365606 RepID=A0ABW4SD36_9BACL
MDFSIILIAIGIIIVFASFFLNNTDKHADELEKVSISLHQETNGLKKRLKAVEEELMIGINPVSTNSQNTFREKPIHEIIVNQILTLKSQGYSIDDIAERASLTKEQVSSVLQSKGAIG